MDQFASVHGAAGRLILLDCRTLEHDLIPFPEDLSIVVADSGVRRELAALEYNARRRGRAADLWTAMKASPRHLLAAASV